MVRPPRRGVVPAPFRPLSDGRDGPAPRGRVLVVDDDATTREQVTTVLKIEGYDVAVAENGEAAVAAHRAKSVDIILMDPRSPGKPGCDAVRDLAAEVPDAVIVAMSSDVDVEPPRRDAPAPAPPGGVRLRLRKPLEPWLLLHTLAGLIAARRSLRGSRLHRSA
jgi:CheY-like chemotaxis protein